MSRPLSVADDELAEFLEKPLGETTVDELAELFRSGEKPPARWMIGLEVELLPFLSDGLGPVEHPGIAKVLARLGKERGLEEVREASGALIGLEGDGVIVSIEPGGQIEYASRPYRALKALREEVDTFCASIRDAGAAEGVGFWAMGQQPFVNRDTAAKMPKARYDLMRKFMPTRGTRGLDMMHLTGSVQCAVDYADEQNMVNKVRTAARASPFIAALTAASPFFEGKISGYESERYAIWLDTDDTRCGIWPEMLDDEGLTYERYVQHAKSTPAMFFLRDGQYQLPEALPLAHFEQAGFEGSVVTVGDFVDHLTSLFPEVRIKRYVELRGNDCAPPHEAIAIAGFWRGLLDDEDTRQRAEERLATMDYSAIRALQPDIAKKGLGADSPIGPVRDIARWLVEISYQRLAKSAPDCAECLEPLVERAVSGRSLAREMIDVAKTSSVDKALELVTI